MSLLLALIVATFVSTPQLLVGRWRWAIGSFIPTILIWWGIFYLGMPSLVWPLGGMVSGACAICWVLLVLTLFLWVETSGQSNWKDIKGLFFANLSPLLAILVVYCIVGISSWPIFRSDGYRSMIGAIENREWTQDIQPKDPKHVRLVPEELAYYLATKQLGEGGGVIGSQFQVRKGMTLQKIKGELWFVSPLDFKGFRSWTDRDFSPGYVMVDAQEPRGKIDVVTNLKLEYMPGAYLGSNLERHIWLKYPRLGFYKLFFQLDENKKPFWVVPVFKPTIGWSAKKYVGIIILDPETGEDKLYDLKDAPNWVDPILTQDIVHNYLTWYGMFGQGWWNSVWGHRNILEPETPDIVFGADDKQYWVTGLTSTNTNDKSLVGIAYTDARTGKTFIYHAVGGTDEAVLELVNNRVSYKKLHGSSPVIYNIYGVMTSIVPLLGESHSYQGVALVDVANMQMAEGEDLESAIRGYQKIIMSGGQTIAPDKSVKINRQEGLVDRNAWEIKGGETIFLIHLDGIGHIFYANTEISPKLPLTKEGDNVVVWYIDSEEDVVPMSKFDNLSLSLQQSPEQEELRRKAEERINAEREEKTTKSVREEIKNMSDEDLKKLLNR